MYDNNTLESQVIITAGHEYGVISFGNSMDDCGDLILQCLSNISVH